MKNELKKLVADKVLTVLDDEHIEDKDKGKILSYAYHLIKTKKTEEPKAE